MSEYKTVGSKVVNERCNRCGGTGIYEWWTTLGKAAGTCFKCGGGQTTERTERPALTEAQQRKGATGSEIVIACNAEKERMELRVDGALVTSAKHLPDWEPSDRGLARKAEFLNEVRTLNGLAPLPVTVILPEERIITPALVISTFLAAEPGSKEAIQALAAELKADPSKLDDSRLADAQAIIDELRPLTNEDGDFDGHQPRGKMRYGSFANTVALSAISAKAYPTEYGKLAYAAKILEQVLGRAAEKAQQTAESRWLGQAGEKIEIDLIVKGRRIYEGGWNRSDTIYYDCETPDGQLVQVKATTTMGINDADGQWVPVFKGAHVRVQATVRELGDYQGRKQTQINRVKIKQIVEQGEEGY